METVPQALAWANYILAWTWLTWFAAAFVIGGTMLALDEWRLHRTRPKPEEVRAYADDLITRHGREAYRINGDAMYEARLAKEFDRHRFLKEVSGELVSRFFSDPSDSPCTVLDRDSTPQGTT